MAFSKSDQDKSVKSSPKKTSAPALAASTGATLPSFLHWRWTEPWWEDTSCHSGSAPSPGGTRNMTRDMQRLVTMVMVEVVVRRGRWGMGRASGSWPRGGTTMRPIVACLLSCSFSLLGKVQILNGRRCLPTTALSISSVRTRAVSRLLMPPGQEPRFSLESFSHFCLGHFLKRPSASTATAAHLQEMPLRHLQQQHASPQQQQCASAQQQH